MFVDVETLARRIVAERREWEMAEVIAVLARLVERTPGITYDRLRDGALRIAADPSKVTPFALLGSAPDAPEPTPRVVRAPVNVEALEATYRAGAARARQLLRDAALERQRAAQAVEDARTAARVERVAAETVSSLDPRSMVGLVDW